MADRVVDPVAMAEVIEQPQDGYLLELPEGQRRAHPGDLGLVSGAIPACRHAKVGYLVVGRRAGKARVDNQARPTSAASAVSQLQTERAARAVRLVDCG